MSARDIDHAEQLFGCIRGVLERNGLGNRPERTNVARAILEELINTPTQPPRLALARALVPEYAVVPREATREMVNAGAIATLEHRLESRHQNAYSPNTRTGGEVFATYRAMLAAGEATP